MKEKEILVEILKELQAIRSDLKLLISDDEKIRSSVTNGITFAVQKAIHDTGEED